MKTGLNAGTNHKGAKVAGKLAGTIHTQEYKSNGPPTIADKDEKKPKKRALSAAEVLYPAKDTSP